MENTENENRIKPVEIIIKLFKKQLQFLKLISLGDSIQLTDSRKTEQ